MPSVRPATYCLSIHDLSTVGHSLWLTDVDWSADPSKHTQHPNHTKLKLLSKGLYLWRNNIELAEVRKRHSISVSLSCSWLYVHVCSLTKYRFPLKYYGFVVFFISSCSPIAIIDLCFFISLR